MASSKIFVRWIQLLLRKCRPLILCFFLVFATASVWYQIRVPHNEVNCAEPPVTETAHVSAPPEDDYYVSPLCFCDKEMDVVNRPSLNSDVKWCSDESSLRGPNQKVVAFSLYDITHNDTLLQRYYNLLNDNALTISKGLPGWIMRVYHNLTSDEGQAKTTYIRMCDIFCRYPHVDLCNVPELVERIRRDNTSSFAIDDQLISGMNPVLFRNLAMLDPNVDMFLSRDSDSVIWRREVNAIQEWLASNYTFHVMRDHHLQKSFLPSGLWGAKIHQKRDEINSLARTLIEKGQQQIDFKDQELLDSVAWPEIKSDVMAHDSYHCKDPIITKNSPIKAFPFPSKRIGDLHVGQVIIEEYADQLPPAKICPPACRPKDHQDWEYC